MFIQYYRMQNLCSFFIFYIKPLTRYFNVFCIIVKYENLRDSTQLRIAYINNKYFQKRNRLKGDKRLIKVKRVFYVLINQFT